MLLYVILHSLTSCTSFFFYASRRRLTKDVDGAEKGKYDDGKAKGEEKGKGYGVGNDPHDIGNDPPPRRSDTKTPAMSPSPAPTSSSSAQTPTTTSVVNPANSTFVSDKGKYDDDKAMGGEKGKGRGVGKDAPKCNKKRGCKKDKTLVRARGMTFENKAFLLT